MILRARVELIINEDTNSRKNNPFEYLKCIFLTHEFHFGFQIDLVDDIPNNKEDEDMDDVMVVESVSISNLNIQKKKI